MRHVVPLLLALVSGCTSGCTLPALELRDLSAVNDCFVDEDCCVVVDGCAAEAYVVTADEFDTARELAGEDSAGCVDCIVPTVTVECVEGRCLGKAFNPADVRYTANQALDSCGARSVETTFAGTGANDDLSFVALDDGVATCGSIPE